MDRQRLKLIFLIGLLISGCSIAMPLTQSGPAATPVPAKSSIVPTATAVSSAAPATPGTMTATPSIAEASAPATATAATYYSVTKASEGGHGGPPLIELPASIAFDYTASGRCVFSLGLSTATSAKGLPVLTMTLTGPVVTGTWRLSIKPDRYYVLTGEAVGCVYSVSVRDDH